MTYKNNSHLRKYLAQAGLPHLLPYDCFELDAARFDLALAQVRAQHPYLDPAESAARAAFRVIARTHKKGQPKPRTRKRLGIRFWLIVASIVAAGLLSAILCARLHAEPTPQNRAAYRNALRGFQMLPAQQPNGIILQFQNNSSILATRPAGLVAFNCAGAGLSCSFSGNTFTLSGSGGTGSGCLPPGTATRLLYDDGAGGCLDSAITWTSGTSTLTAPSGSTITWSGTGIINARKINGVEFTNSESLGKIPIGQGDGTAVWSDPLVSGVTPHDGAGSSTNPVAIGGYASAAAPTDVSADGDITRAWYLRNGSQVVNLASGGTLFTSGQKAMSSSFPVAIASDQSALSSNITQLNSISLASPFDVDTSAGTQNVIGISWRKSASGGSVEFGTSSDPVRIDPTGTTTQPVSGTITANQGSSAALSSAWPVKVTDGTNTMPTGDAASRKIFVQVTDGTDNLSCLASGACQSDLTSIGGTAVLTGNGTTGAGSQRVTVASDNSATPGIGGSATGSAVPSTARYIAGNGTGNLVGYLNCDNTAVYDASTNGSTQLVALTSGQTIYVCGYQISTSQSSAVNVNLRYGTGTNCATGATNITPSYPLQAAASTGPIGLVVMTPGFTGLKTAASNALCINTNAAVSVQAIVWYTKF